MIKPLFKDQQKGRDIKIKISNKWMKHRFPCCMDYITNNCEGRCCESGTKILVSLLLKEEGAHKRKGHKVINGLLEPNPRTGKCPYKLKNGLCTVHGTKMKPFGCIASPFTLNSADTLIIRHRYSCLKCHGCGDPAYVAFKKSLALIFGKNETQKIIKKLKLTNNDFMVNISSTSYNNLKYLDGLKYNERKNTKKE